MSHVYVCRCHNMEDSIGFHRRGVPRRPFRQSSPAPQVYKGPERPRACKAGPRSSRYPAVTNFSLYLC